MRLLHHQYAGELDTYTSTLKPMLQWSTQLVEACRSHTNHASTRRTRAYTREKPSKQTRLAGVRRGQGQQSPNLTFCKLGPRWFKIYLTRQAYTSLQGQRSVEPTWFKFTEAQALGIVVPGLSSRQQDLSASRASHVCERVCVCVCLFTCMIIMATASLD